MPRGIKGSGPNGVKSVTSTAFTVLTETQKQSLVNSANNILGILGGAGLGSTVAQHAVPIKRRRRRNTQPQVQTPGMQ